MLSSIRKILSHWELGSTIDIKLNTKDSIESINSLVSENKTTHIKMLKDKILTSRVHQQVQVLQHLLLQSELVPVPNKS